MSDDWQVQFAVNGQIVVGDPDCDRDPCVKHGTCHCRCACGLGDDDDCDECAAIYADPVPPRPV